MHGRIFIEFPPLPSHPPLSLASRQWQLEKNREKLAKKKRKEIVASGKWQQAAGSMRQAGNTNIACKFERPHT